MATFILVNAMKLYNKQFVPDFVSIGWLAWVRITSNDFQLP